MKLLLALSAYFILVFHSMEAHANPSAIEPVENRAVVVDYFGGFTGYDRGGYQVLRSAIGQLVADGTIGYFITEAVGKSGGGSFCLELALNTEKSIEDVLKVLRAIKPADEVTVYRIKLQTECILQSYSTKGTK